MRSLKYKLIIFSPGILSNFDLIEAVQVEFKDSLIGDHLSPAYSPRLRKLGVSGSTIDNIAIGAFAGITRYVAKQTIISN